MTEFEMFPDELAGQRVGVSQQAAADGPGVRFGRRSQAGPPPEGGRGRLPRRPARQLAAEPGVLRPARQVVVAELDRQAGGAVRRVELARVLDDRERLVPGRDLLAGAGQGAPGAAQPAQQRLADRVVIGLDALDLGVGAEPGHGPDPDPSERPARADAVPDGLAHAIHFGGVGPAALEWLQAVGPMDLEWFQTTDVTDPYLRHVIAPPVAPLKEGDRPPAPISDGQSTP